MRAHAQCPRVLQRTGYRSPADPRRQEGHRRAAQPLDRLRPWAGPAAMQRSVPACSLRCRPREMDKYWSCCRGR
ncbi:hypothetical protein NDU88_010782 [Pleurodeles waltl]|uniref:Uncharacterized protein n=1 Tax=Pleurodeles waltl TaxID=8319 RepID=A0AAV7S506_PLEWA|nr:hypothetical protein NDU88_010782 [Pleurodeles waltl]